MENETRYTFYLCPIGRAVLLSGVLLAAFGCERAPEQPVPIFPVDPAGIYVPARQVPLYADLSDYNLLQAGPGTRAGEDPVSLESLLDRRHRKTITFKGARMTLTPFLQNEQAVLASFGEAPDSSLASATCVKKYYVESAKGAYRGSFVATMVTSRQYDASHPGFDYFTMPDYTGAGLCHLGRTDFADKGRGECDHGRHLYRFFRADGSRRMDQSVLVLRDTVVERRRGGRDLRGLPDYDTCTGYGKFRGQCRG